MLYLEPLFRTPQPRARKPREVLARGEVLRYRRICRKRRSREIDPQRCLRNKPSPKAKRTWLKARAQRCQGREPATAQGQETSLRSEQLGCTTWDSSASTQGINKPEFILMSFNLRSSHTASRHLSAQTWRWDVLKRLSCCLTLQKRSKCART